MHLYLTVQTSLTCTATTYMQDLLKISIAVVNYFLPLLQHTHADRKRYISQKKPIPGSAHVHVGRWVCICLRELSLVQKIFLIDSTMS